jgi:hypothetical protein
MTPEYALTAQVGSAQALVMSLVDVLALVRDDVGPELLGILLVADAVLLRVSQKLDAIETSIIAPNT